MVPLPEELQKMKEMDVRKAVREELVDISSIEIDQTLPATQRIRAYLEQVKNPFLVRCGDYVIKLSYAASPRGMEECIGQAWDGGEKPCGGEESDGREEV